MHTRIKAVFALLVLITGGRRRSTGRLTTVLLLQGMAWMLLAGCGSGDHREIDFSERISDAELREMAPGPDPEVLRFGFDLRASPQEDARQYLPFLAFLERVTGYRFELRFTPGNGDIVHDLGTGRVQFAALGAGSYLEARARYGVVPLVRGLNAQGRPEYQSVIITLPDSPIHRITDLRGKSFAFGSRTSTQGHLIPKIIFRQHGLTLKDLAGCEFTGSHQNCANAVTAGHCDAGGLQDVMGRQLAEAGLVRIIHESEYYPSSGIVANRDVPTDIRERVKRALLDFQPTGSDASGLHHWDRTEMPNGFIEAHDGDYAELRERSREFGLIQEPGEERKP